LPSRPLHPRSSMLIVDSNGLQKFRFEEIAAWGYPDGVFASDYDIVSDTSKARRFGFHELVDTEEIFLRMFRIFGGSGSFRDLPTVLTEDWRGPAERVVCLLMKDLACARWIISRSHWRRGARSSGEPTFSKLPLPRASRSSTLERNTLRSEDVFALL
jgi:hypothetical protein